MGLTEKMYKEILALNVNCVTMGNHTFGNSGIYDCSLDIQLENLINNIRILSDTGE